MEIKIVCYPILCPHLYHKCIITEFYNSKIEAYTNSCKITKNYCVQLHKEKAFLIINECHSYVKKKKKKHTSVWDSHTSFVQTVVKLSRSPHIHLSEGHYGQICFLLYKFVVCIKIKNCWMFCPTSSFPYKHEGPTSEPSVILPV